MTQSAISKQVAQLEEMLNLSLFYRTPHRISLTPAGKSYYLEVLADFKTYRGGDHQFDVA